MSKYEKGFTYPLTLAIVLLFLCVFTFRIEQLLTERKLAFESKTLLREDYYFHSSIKKIEKIMETGSAVPSKGSFPYLNGSMGYTVELPVGSIQRINFTLKMNTGDSVYGSGFFDTKLKKMTKWVEIN